MGRQAGAPSPPEHRVPRNAKEDKKPKKLEKPKHDEDEDDYTVSRSHERRRPEPARAR